MVLPGASGKAVSLVVTTFSDDIDDGPWNELPFEGHCERLTAALTHLGYEAKVSKDPDAKAIGTLVNEVITSGAPGVRIVHVLSHGHRVDDADAENLYVLGSDGWRFPETNVNQWMAYVAAQPEVPHTLFLLDLCRSGSAARAPLPIGAYDERRRTWVIGAAAGDEMALDARFTRASVNVLTDLHSGRMDMYGSLRYVPLDAVAKAISRETAQLVTATEYRQRVTGSMSDITVDLSALPFFPNPHYESGDVTAARAGSDEAVGPYVDEVLDVSHWRQRSSGHGYPTIRTDTGCFAGRKNQLVDLTDWLTQRKRENQVPDDMHVVTGSPGSGKSALLGILVCAAHEALSASTERLWTPVFTHWAPSTNKNLAAVHARQRDISAICTSLAGQLGLQMPVGEWSTTDLLEMIRIAAEQPVIVVDALDEMADSHTLLDRLLLPLVRTRRPDGGPAARLLIGVRNPLPDALGSAVQEFGGEPTDLDKVPPDMLKEDLRQYVGTLLRLNTRYEDKDHEDARLAFAEAVADTLAAGSPSDGERWGEFLVAALYTHHLLARPDTISDEDEAARLGRSVPHTLPDILRDDLRARTEPAWFRPLLTALAYSRGQGMPLSVLRRVVPIWLPGHGEPSIEDMQKCIDDARFYLRQSPDNDGVTLYRLFHQTLTDHLRDSTADQVMLESRILDALITPLRFGGGRAWQVAEAYVLRHAPHHAFDAGRLNELATDPAFLIHADMSTLLPMLDVLGPEADSQERAVLRTSAHQHRRAAPAARRDILVLDATRWALPDLADSLAGVSLANRSVPEWQPEWASGSSVCPALRATLTGNQGQVNGVAYTVVKGGGRIVTVSADWMVRVWGIQEQTLIGQPLEGHRGAVLAVDDTVIDDVPVAVTGGADRTVRLWNTAECLPLGLVGSRPRAITAVACTLLDKRPIAVTGEAGGPVCVWDLADCRQIGEPLLGHSTDVVAVATIMVAEVPVAVTTDARGTVRIWDLYERTPRHDALGGHRGLVTAVACTDLDGRPVAVTAGLDGTIRVWDLTTGLPDGEMMVAAKPLYAVVCTVVAGIPVAVTSGDDQVLSIWNLRTRELKDRPLSGHTEPVRALAVAETDESPVLISGGVDRTVRLWDPSITKTVGDPVPGHTESITAAACTAGSGRRMIVTAGEDRTVRVWDDASRRSSLTWTADEEVFAVTCALIEGRDIVIAGDAQGALWLWDIADDTLKGPFFGHTAPIRAIACTTVNAKAVAVTVGDDQIVRIWDLEDQEPVGLELGDQGALGGGPNVSRLRAVACTRRGGLPIAVTADDSVRLWNLAQRSPLVDPASGLAGGLTGNTAPIRAVDTVLLQGEQVVVTGGDDGVMGIWDIGRGVLRSSLGTHTAPVVKLTCTTLDERPYAIAAHEDRTVRAWDLRQGESTTLLTFPEDVTALATDHAGRLVTGVGRDIVVLTRSNLRTDSRAGH